MRPVLVGMEDVFGRGTCGKMMGFSRVDQPLSNGRTLPETRVLIRYPTQLGYNRGLHIAAAPLLEFYSVPKTFDRAPYIVSPKR